MSDLIEELSSQGFEIVQDETGQNLVKLVFMDENDETTGYALVSLEDAKRIISGQATLQNVLDEEGKQVLTLASVDNNEGSEFVEAAVPNPATTVSADFEGEKNDEAASCPSNTKADGSEGEVPAAKPSENTVSNGGTPALKDEEDGTDQLTDAVEQFTLSEQTGIVNNVQVQVVTLVDSRGEVLDQKHGQTGEQVILEMHGQAFSYEIQGPTETGEAITSTLLVSSGDSDGVEAATTNGEQNDTNQEMWNNQNTVGQGSDFNDSSTIPPSGQQFTLTEAVTIVNGEALQTVLLTDENGNVLDQKQGRTGEHVIIEMNGNSLEYVFLGPTETGEPITTTLVVTTDTEAAEPTPTGSSITQESSDDTEAGLTVAKWCPTGLPSEFYTILRRQAEVVVATRCPRNADSNINQPEPYHRKLGPYTAYVEMLGMVNNYRVGANQGETLELYESLRNYARIYRPSGPHSRALTKYELALNEAAAQICRFQPGLLFHKRDLFHLAKETVERSQTLLNTERRQQNQQLQQQQQQQQQTQAKTSGNAQRQTSAQNSSKSKVSTPLPQPPRSTPQTVAVGGRVANSQLALLESRGLSAIQQSSTQNQLSTLTNAVNDVTSETAFTSNTQTNGTSSVISTFTNKARVLPTDNNVNYLSNLPMVKRDAVYKLAQSEEEAIRVASIDVLSDLPSVEIKVKTDCTNIERACWDQARQLATQIPSQDLASGGTSIERINEIQSLVCSETRVDSVRELAALYGRPPGGIQPPNVVGLPRSAPIPVLTPYEIACNEAASFLAAGMPSLLTHRRELAELAKKVVRNSGCLFTHTPTSDKISIGGGGYRFYCSDQLPELDLSAAEHLLADPLDRSDSPDSGCVTGPEDGDTENITDKCESLALSCQECNNVIDDITIFAATGTDSLKKVLILNLSDCGFTGLIPMHLNQCANLTELNLSGNAFYALPRCLHLPKLRRLNIARNANLVRMFLRGPKNDPPLVEQFPRLSSLEIDATLVPYLSTQSLAYLCPHLKTINGEEFVEEPTEETIASAQAAKNNLSALIYSKWEDDIAGFYKKGLPKRDTICVVETLVLHAVNRSMEIAQPFTHCKSILARHIAEDFLAPKLLDDECDEEGDHFRANDTSDEENTGTNSDTDDEVEYQKDKTVADKTELNGEEKLTDGSKYKDDTSSATQTDLKSKMFGRKKLKSAISSEAAQASVAQREAEAVAANLALLPDEAPDRLINVVGQALQHGKTVVYAVMRTAARQPNGELIPIGGLFATNNSSTNSIVQQVASVDETTKSCYEDEYDESDTENTPLSEHQPIQPPTPIVTKLPSRQPAGGAILGTRRPGLLNRASSSPHFKHNRAPIVSSTARDYSSEGITTITQRRFNASDYIIRPSTSTSESAYIVPNIQTQSKPASPWAPGRRGRPPLALSLAKKAAAAEAEAEETSNLIKSVTIPPPHAPPPSTMRMSTRDSNRHKRFSAYGVIDTAAALAGKEEALLAAALALEDEQEASTVEQIMQDSAVVLSEGDAAAAEAVALKSKAIDPLIEVNDADDEEEEMPPADKPTSLSPEKVLRKDTTDVAPNTRSADESARRRRRRSITSQPAIAVSEPFDSPQEVSTPSVSRKRRSTSPKVVVESKRKSTAQSQPITTPEPTVSVSTNSQMKSHKPGLSELGEVSSDQVN